MSESAINAPKGLLRLLILDITSKSPVSGAEIIKHIKIISNSMWTPSPGSIYPILKNLQKNEYITDMFGRIGNLVNIDTYYMFQPLEIDNKQIKNESSKEVTLKKDKTITREKNNKQKKK